VDSVVGDADRPMATAQAIAKFRRFAGLTLGEAGTDRAIAALMHDAPAEGFLA